MTTAPMLDEHGIIPLALGDNWAYLLPADDGLILIDAGPDYPGSWDALVGQLHAAGCEPRDVRHVMITHAHVDHCGLASRWQALGATVAGSAAEAPQFLQGSNIIGYAVREMFEFWRQCGVPEARVAGYIEARERIRAAYRSGDNTGGGARRERWPGLIRGTPFTPDRLLRDGDELRHGGRRIQFIDAPGHTPGNAVYYEPETRVLFSGDQVIPGVNPNPGWHWNQQAEPPQRCKGLLDFALSLEKVQRLDAVHAYPGHGEATDDIEGEIGRMQRRNERRQTQLLELLAEGEQTPYQLLAGMFKRMPDRRLYQALAEVTGHLDVLEYQGKAQTSTINNIIHYRLAAS